MQPFFIISLPRCRTAWLANFLTHGNAFCFHELMRTCSTLDELESKMTKDGNCQGSIVGDADPSLAPIAGNVAARFPDARFVFIYRPVEDVVKSLKAAFPNFNPSSEGLERTETEIANAQETPGLNYIEVDFLELDTPAICDEIHEFCVGRPMNIERWKMLSQLRVTAIAEKAYSTLAPWARVQVAKLSAKVTPADLRWYDVLRRLCGGNQAAYDWLFELWGLASSWDHISDGDEVDRNLLDLSLEAVLLKWPGNWFYQKHAAYLAPVLSNALSAWRDGGRARHYDIYSEAALAVAYLIGGPDHAKQFSPQVREAAAALLQENDKGKD